MRTTSRLLAFMLLTAAVPSRAADQAKVEAAIKKGAEFLKKTVSGGGDGGVGGRGGEYGSGALSLAGLAMLEAGTPPADPVMVELAARVREASYSETKTYQTALGIIFLDRYGDPGDRPLIQVLGARLMYGQTAAGGWTYSTFDEIPAAEAQRLAAALRTKGAAPKGPAKKEDDGFTVSKPSASPTGAGLHAEANRIVQAVRAGAAKSGNGPAGGLLAGDDNSNTQFAIIGLWVARRRGLPCDPQLRAIEARFVRSQSPGDWGWGYNSSGGGPGGSTPSMTCAGLIGLAVGKAVAESKPAKKKEDHDPFFDPPKDADDDKDSKPKAPATARDAAIERGLTAIGRLIGGGGGQPLGVQAATTHGMGGVGDLYFFWSLERVAVAFGLDTIGGKSWFEWGAAQILPAQAADGSWQGSYSPTVSTAFAVLFLCRSNFVTDLTKTINQKVKDPGESVLTGRKGPLVLNRNGRAADAPKDSGPQLPPGPELTDPAAAGRVEELATALVNSTDSKWKPRLDAARDRKGPEYTLALLVALPHLDGGRLAQAREALAERLVRMTPETLRKMMEDRDPELRRAAVLAAAMRDDRSFTPGIIDRILDIDDGVTRAARAALKSLSDGKDFGPPTGASDDAKRKAADDWRYWYASEGKR